mmetsp:Transcript_40497/g.114708  ORF Transcript_40497/g.114708 Transcript_40497/m.114708 type:complete len:387 (-) Transcript_40497:1002-2162(-)
MEPILEPEGAAGELSAPMLSQEPVIAAENSYGIPEENLDMAADALTRQYMKLRMSGSLDGRMTAPAGPRGPTSKKKKKKALRDMPLLPPPIEKLYTPGPGAYSPQIDRYSAKTLHSPSYSFAGGNMGQIDRSFIRHYIAQQVSPGPMYTPSKEPSSRLRSIESISFKRDAVNSRNRYEHGHPTNSPFYNPGPGSYAVSTDPKGNKVDAGEATASYTFGNSSFHHPELELKKTCYLTAGHERENYGVHSPGPQYYPNGHSTSKFDSTPAFTVRKRGTIVWDEMLKPKNCYAPGPMYKPDLDRKGGRFLHTLPKWTFAREDQRPESMKNLSATSFISERHATISNHSVHSPGYIYNPNKPEMHKPSINFNMSGPKDRFYDRFEQNRIL